MKTKRHSLMAKATLIIMILILPFNIIGIFTAYMSYRSAIDNTRDVISYTLDAYSSQLSTKIVNCNYLLYDTTVHNQYFTTMVKNTDSPLYQIYSYDFFRGMNEQLSSTNSADQVFIYLLENEDYLQMPAYTSTNAGQKDFLSYATDYDYAYASWFMNEDHSKLIRVMYSATYQLYYGVAIDLNAQLNRMGKFDGYPSMTYSFTSDPVEGSRKVAAFNSGVLDNLYLTATVNYSDLYSNINIMIYIFILFFIAYLALIPLLIHLMRRHVAVPLLQLNHAQGELENGNEDYRIETEADSKEFDTAYHSFNKMATSIKTLHADVLEKELSNKQLQIDFLQLQIRPHFLLNAFNVLYTLIQKEEKESSQDMILFLSDYFRYLFRSGRELQLFSKERKLIEDYLRISKIYYPISFEVSYQLDPALDMMRVPPLLLHSFIENIIAHALLPNRPIHIVFSGEYDNKTVTFYISDDGKGMDEANVQAINHACDRPIDDGQNVGIKNSIRRLAHYYGPDASVSCESELGVGTTFIIIIPYDLDEN